MRALGLGLKKGARIEVQVTEVLPNEALIVSFEGRLFRIQNASRSKIEKNQILKLTVLHENPLQLRIETRTTTHLDRFA